MKRIELVRYLDELLQVGQYQDYAPNGLQVSGCDDVQCIVAGVTASQLLIDHAVAVGADAILVHHGYFWRGESQVITGIKQKRIKALLSNDINLLAYHLPLDGHEILGNTVQLCTQFEWQSLVTLPMAMNPSVGRIAHLPKPLTGEELVEHIGDVLQRTPLHIPVDRLIQSIAVVTGAAQDCLMDAVEAGCDAFLSGEISERTTHLAREYGVHYFAAGHHATERYGVKALAAHLQLTHGLDCQFVDIDNPA